MQSHGHPTIIETSDDGAIIATTTPTAEAHGATSLFQTLIKSLLIGSSCRVRYNDMDELLVFVGNQYYNLSQLLLLEPNYAAISLDATDLSYYVDYLNTIDTPIRKEALTIEQLKDPKHLFTVKQYYPEFIKGEWSALSFYTHDCRFYRLANYLFRKRAKRGFVPDRPSCLQLLQEIAAQYKVPFDVNDTIFLSHLIKEVLIHAGVAISALNKCMNRPLSVYIVKDTSVISSHLFRFQGHAIVLVPIGHQFAVHLVLYSKHTVTDKIFDFYEILKRNGKRTMHQADQDRLETLMLLGSKMDFYEIDSSIAKKFAEIVLTTLKEHGWQQDTFIRVDKPNHELRKRIKSIQSDLQKIGISFQSLNGFTSVSLADSFAVVNEIIDTFSGNPQTAIKPIVTLFNAPFAFGVNIEFLSSTPSEQERLLLPDQSVEYYAVNETADGIELRAHLGGSMPYSAIPYVEEQQLFRELLIALPKVLRSIALEKNDAYQSLLKKLADEFETLRLCFIKHLNWYPHLLESASGLLLELQLLPHAVKLKIDKEFPQDFDSHFPFRLDIQKMIAAIKKGLSKQKIAITEKHHEIIAKIVAKCNDCYSNQEYYGADALNRKILLDAEIASYLSAELCAIIFYAELEKNPIIQLKRKLSDTKTCTTTIANVLFYGFKDLAAIELLNPNESEYGIGGYIAQCVSFQKHTKTIVLNLFKVSQVLAINMTFDMFHRGEVKATFCLRYSKVLKTVKQIDEMNKLPTLLYNEAEFTVQELHKQVFIALCLMVKRTGVTGFVVNANIHINAAMNFEHFAEMCLYPDVLLDGEIAHLFFDKLHLLAAMTSPNKIHINHISYTVSDLLFAMVKQCDRLPSSSLSYQQLSLRMRQVEMHLIEHPEFSNRYQSQGKQAVRERSNYHDEFTLAVQSGDLLKMQSFLESGFRWHQHVFGTRGVTALHYAAEKGDCDMLELLLKKPYSSNIVNCTNYRKQTALHSAVICGWTDAVKLLLAEGARIDCSDYNAILPIHFAAKYNPTLEIMLLLNPCAFINQEDAEGRRPLHYAACFNQNSEMLLFLLENGADVNAPDSKGRKAIHYAGSTTALHVACLLSFHANIRDAYIINGHEETIVEHAIHAKNYFLLRELVLQFGFSKQEILRRAETAESPNLAAIKQSLSSLPDDVPMNVTGIIKL